MDHVASLFKKATSLFVERPEKFKGLKSYQAFSQTVGELGGHIEIWEFESMNDIDALFKTMLGDEELKKIPQEFFSLVEPGTYRSPGHRSLPGFQRRRSRASGSCRCQGDSDQFA